MDANAFRHLYDYHFAANRLIWDKHITNLSQEQFIQPVDYSVGSVRNQVVHMMDVDNRWFGGLRGEDVPEFLDPAQFTERDQIRSYSDNVEAKMRDYLANLHDNMLFGTPFPDSEDDMFKLWQVLIHVANHGTDHRAQLLRILHDLGQKTTAQDYFFYVIGDL